KSGKQEEAKEEIVIVDLAPPPPPPPPPPPMEPENLSEPEEMDESEDIAEADAPEDMSDEPSDDIDLGLDAGDLASGPGTGSFVVSVPRIGGRRGSGGGGGGGLMDDVDAPPTPVSKIQPNYPSTLLSKGIGGKVLVACVVDESGKVVSSSIKQSAHAELDKAALAAVAKWKFKPAQKAGRNVRASCVVPFNFEVKKS
ncbi:MAG: energy transducer TonB, partial [Cytophagaceae bacterium]